jgi:hypothetical protein
MSAAVPIYVQEMFHERIISSTACCGVRFGSNVLGNTIVCGK